MDPLSQYLIDMGWRPAPSVSEHGAWEHPVMSICVASMSAEGYTPGRVRWTKPCAVALTSHIHEIADRIEALQR